MNVRHGLRFDALRRVDNQQRAFACREAARNFIGKIDVPRRVEQVQPIALRQICSCNASPPDAL